jgi:hypothetical protein
VRRKSERGAERLAHPDLCPFLCGDHQHVFYTRLVNDPAIYNIGLAKRDRTLAPRRALLDQYRTQAATFACPLVPRKARGNAPNRLRLISPYRFAGRILRPRACPTLRGTLAARRASHDRERAARHMSTAAGPRSRVVVDIMA